MKEVLHYVNDVKNNFSNVIQIKLSAVDLFIKKAFFFKGGATEPAGSEIFKLRLKTFLGYMSEYL